MQTAAHLLMIRPVQFAFNTETAVNNTFQVQSDTGHINALAQAAFDNFVALLRSHAIDVRVINDTADIFTPDALFPNNWISMHADGQVVLYPMFAPNRRAERNKGVLKFIKEHFIVNSTIDLSNYEKEHLFLEGTGSMVFDHVERKAYACLSPRTDLAVLNTFCSLTGYTPVAFNATDQNNIPVYHTNVMMSIAEKYALVALESIKDEDERKLVEEMLTDSGKEIIPLTLSQIVQFAGNALQVRNKHDERFLVLSTAGFSALTDTQKATIEKYNPIIHSSLQIIEQNGGGSARCMIAEIFLTPLNR